MPLNEVTILNIEPRLTETADGSWLAVSGARAPLSLGVFGETAEDARLLFEEALERRVAILRSGNGDRQAEA